MKWTTGLSRKPETTQAFRDACAGLDVSSAAEVDVLLVFFSASHTDDVEELSLAMARDFPDAVCVGCNANGVIGAGDEAETGSSLAVTAGILPGVDVEPIRFEPDVHDRSDFDWRQQFGGDPEVAPNFLILSEPTTFETEELLTALDRAFPDSSKFGGLVSGGGQGQGSRLILEGHVYHGGAIGLAFSGDLRVDTVVAQACRPIGEPLIVTDHTQNIIHRFDRGNPMEVFRNLVHNLEGKERELAQHSMFVGIGVESKRGEYRPGDFVIRNIVGFNPKTGDLAVAAPIEDLDVLQFHLMDPRTSSYEFERVVEELAEALNDPCPSRGALLFSGTSNSEDLERKANEESQLLRDRLGQLPIGGFLSEGEIGPVGGKTCLHGYASMVAVFREAGRAK
ncbi:hypothetical protein FIV42_26125 [Persicimonas caeni]|uniref:Histidine kinase n=1 Tax=Persicimonas caeni TaxID=2292766 RepID=A0A4Y6Q0I5_PERCE|nr:FIST N-terminal domain-containing protein [Persicimonas caeni]QDG54091.1 hypothetical protein FIV42_26125 [Persicimonas caeni]QED35312.1 hypothetical protein FRD00_26120 [Persicimonas caeni]